MNAREIDWSKAPAGATHFGPESEEWIAAWYKLNEGEWFAMLTSDDDQWDCSPCVDDERVSQMIQRPSAWSGTDLPPVGTVCEVNHQGWRRCEVFAHKVEGDNDPDALFSYTKDNGKPGWNWARDQSRFRPIRTPEQIAAEQREKAINDMAKIVGWVPTNIDSFAKLYDAGYRKTAN